MSYLDYSKNCKECGQPIGIGVAIYSTEKLAVSLCRKCQDWFNQILRNTTPETLILYFALKERGVPAEIEKFDGYKTIDIAVTEAKMNIEVDGGQHNFDSIQALSDLKRTLYSLKKGYYTLRVPNSIIRYDLELTADLITEILVENRKRIL